MSEHLSTGGALARSLLLTIAIAGAAWMGAPRRRAAPRRPSPHPEERRNGGTAMWLECDCLRKLSLVGYEL